MSGQGEGNPYLEDDLSGRIYAAYHALRRAKIRDARGLIEVALNKRKILRHSTNKVTDWGPDEVYERVKQFQQSLHRHVAGLKMPKQAATMEREQLVNGWVFRFHRRYSAQPQRETP